MSKTKPPITQTETQLQTPNTWRRNTIGIPKFLLVWVHQDALVHFLEGGDHIILSLGEELDNITNAISNSQGSLYNIISYLNLNSQYYSTGMIYKDGKKLTITKYQPFSLFQDLITEFVPPTN